MCVTTSEKLSKNLNGYITAACNDEKVYITAEAGNVVLVSEEYLRGLEETIFLNSIPGMKESIVEGAKTPTEECRVFDWKNELA